MLLGAFSPSLVALWLTARAEGSTGVRALLGRVLQWRVAVPWYLFAVGYIPVIKLTVALVHRVATGAWPRFGDEAWYVIPLAIAFSTPFQAGEEIGWRGYALPRLATRFGLARASILLDERWARALEEQTLELESCAARVRGANDALRLVFLAADDKGLPMVRWLERRGGGTGREANVTACAAPVDISQALRDALFERVDTAVLTSATLATKDGFGFLRRRIGLVRVPVHARATCASGIVAHAFDQYAPDAATA